MAGGRIQYATNMFRRVTSTDHRTERTPPGTFIGLLPGKRADPSAFGKAQRCLPRILPGLAARILSVRV